MVTVKATSEYSSMATLWLQWGPGEKAEWRNSGMAEWRNSGMAEWRNGHYTNI